MGDKRVKVAFTSKSAPQRHPNDHLNAVECSKNNERYPNWSQVRTLSLYTNNSKHRSPSDVILALRQLEIVMKLLGRLQASAAIMPTINET